MSFSPNRVAVFAISFVCSACAGKSTVDESHPDPNPSGGGGGSAQGGAGNVAGLSQGGSAGTISTACPSNRPAVGSPCNYAGQCFYPIDLCSSSGFECLGGIWQLFAPTQGPARGCSSYYSDGIPHDGDSCACQGVLDCTFDECNTQGNVHATCDNSVWHVTSEPCADRPCGPDGLRCKVGEACVLPGELAAIYECIADPCAQQSETTSCQCAASLCASFQACSMVGGVVQCPCPSC